MVDDDAIFREPVTEYLRINGFDVLEAGRIRSFDPAAPVVIVTGADDAEAPRRAHEMGATAVLRKPVDLDELLRGLCWDGSGYPDGLRGEAIPLAARIMAVADVYDALHTERPYKPALEHANAVEILLRETDAGASDPRVVTAFVGVLGRWITARSAPMATERRPRARLH